MRLFIAIYITLLIFAGCKSKPAGEELSSGERSFKRYCQTCHVLPKPTMKTDEQWPEFVSRYGQRAKLSEEIIADITSFLILKN